MGNRDYELLVLLGIISIFTILGYQVLPSLIGSTVYLYYFKPLFWAGLSLYVWKRPRCRFKGRLRLYRYILLWSVICSILYISLYFASGFLDGIGLSPYTKDLRGMFMNILCIGSVLALMEWVRNYIINRVKKKYMILFSVIVVFVFSLYRLNLRMILSLETWPQIVEYIGEYALPEIMVNVLLTYMVYIGGAYPSIIYIVLTSIPVWVIPVLPNMKWITRAFVGIMPSAAFMLVIRQIYKKQTKEVKLRDQKHESPLAWIITSVVSISLIWFAVGVFPIFPTVILTGSMKPEVNPGDVAVIEKSDGGNLKVGDVIQYWTGDIFIMHRIISIDGSSGKYQTKGDNNSSPDAKLIGAEQVRGKMVGVIPKIGMISIWMRANQEAPAEQVEF